MPKKIIYAEDAIKAVHDLYAIFGSEGEWVDRKDVFEAIDSLPPAQPKIVLCKDCKHWNKSELLCEEWDYYISNEDFYCGCAERRQDGQ